VALLLALACLTGSAHGQTPKVHTVGKDGLKIEGTVDARDRPVAAMPNPKAVRPLALPAKEYRVQLKGGATYRLDLVSREIDAFLVVQDQGGRQLALDDDGGGDLNARLTFTPTADGVYKVFAATLKGAGKFTLTVRPDVPKVQDVGKVQEIGPAGLRLTGTLDENTKRRVYPVKLVAGKTYQIDMTSPDYRGVDPFLRLLDATGKELAFNDDIDYKAKNLNARIIFRAPTTGTYRIVASSYRYEVAADMYLDAGKGPYNLEVREKP
jgi:hypothetical protein